VDDNDRIVNVHFTAPPFGPYGYTVPAALSPFVGEGTAVSVALGKRQAAGIAGRDAEPEDVDYREVDAVLGASLYVPSATMSAVRFAATYYAASPGEALRLALPAPPKTRFVDYYYVTRRYVEAPGGFALGPGEAELAEKIRRSGWFRASAPLDERLLEPLSRLVEVGAVAADRAAAKPEPDDCVVTRLEGAEPGKVRGAKQLLLLDVLERSGGSAPLRELTDAGVPTSTITRACEKGYVSAYLRVDAPSARNEEEETPLLIAGGSPEGRLARAIDGLGDCVKRGRQALIVIPEVYRAPGVAEFVGRETRTDVFEYHSGISPGRRFTVFKRVGRGTVRVVVGTRSALFLPFVDLGMAVVLDEQDPSHKQLEMAPFYASRETATVVARSAGSRLVFTSAAPSAEAYRAAKEGRWRLEELPASGARNRPRFVDMDKEIKTAGSSVIISSALQTTVSSSVEAGKSAVLIIDRRGYVPYVYCDTCGYVFRCRRCDVAMVYHLDEKAMRCHHCGSAEPFPPYCPECHKRTLVGIGLGTEKVADEAARLFPGAVVARADRDALRTAGRTAGFRRRFEAGELDVVVGTRMVLRGVGDANVGVVGVISADTALTLPDFRASERTFQLVVRLAEEVRPGTPVFVQTFYGSHHCFTAAVDGDYDAFWRAEMPLREKLGLPPYRRLVLVRLDGRDEEKVAERADEAAADVRATFGGGGEVVGPVPAPIRRIRDRYRMQILVKTDAPTIFKRGPALAALNRPGGKRTVGVRVDVDPVEFL
jgi:primosomal protein N' (replication factor Y)